MSYQELLQQMIGMTLVLLLLAGAGCKTQQPPPPVQAPGWEDVTVYTVCLDVNQSPSDFEVFRSVKKATRGILTGIGVRVKSFSCDAKLSLQMKGEALEASYQGQGRCYTGAKVRVEVSLTASDQEPLSRVFCGEHAPPFVVAGCPKPVFDSVNREQATNYYR